jgi:hypothetical protein
MKKQTQLLIALLLAFGVTSWAQQTPAGKQAEAISIAGATAHIGDGTLIENCTIIFEDGKIIALGAGEATQGTVIDAT